MSLDFDNQNIKVKKMPRPEKTSIGILFGRSNFTIQESLGEISELIIDSMNGKVLEEEFFSEFSVQHLSKLRLKSSDSTKFLHLDPSNIVYTRDQYNQAHTVVWDETKSEFTKLWNIIKKAKKLNEIRRIGIVSEYRIECVNNDQSKILHDNFTKFEENKNVKKFTMSFETHYPCGKSEEFSAEEDEFINVIEQYYDGLVDRSHSEDGYINVLLDVQHYYSPVTASSNCLDEINKLYGVYLEHEKQLKARIIKMGLQKNE